MFNLLSDSNCASINQADANIAGEKTTYIDDDSENAMGDSPESDTSHDEAKREISSSASLDESISSTSSVSSNSESRR
jgi:hypothetical protein